MGWSGDTKKKAVVGGTIHPFVSLECLLCTSLQGESQIDPARVDSMSSIGKKKNLIFLIPERKEDSPKTEKDHGDCREPLQVSLELGMRSSFLGHCADVVFLEQ